MPYPYLTLQQFKAIAPLPAAYVDEVEVSAPGFTQLQLELESSYCDSLLAKRYATPFLDANGVPDAPLVVRRWVVALVTLQVWLRRGLDGTQLDAQTYIDAAEQARNDLQAAADAKDGLFSLPLRSDTNANGIIKPTLRSYSETSPFVATRIQAKQGREEDSRGEGTRR